MKQRQNEAQWIESRQRWQINIQSDGERKTFSSSTPGAKGKIQAERKADRWLTDQRKTNVRFNTLWTDFLAHEKETTGTANYKKHESLGRLWLLPELKHRRVDTLRLKDWQTCINTAHKEGKSRRTLTNIRASITAAYNYARENKILMDRPEGIKIHEDAPVGERKILQPTDLKVLFSDDSITHYGKKSSCHYIHAWRFYALTGLRRGELCGLAAEDIVDDRILFIRRSINSENETTKGKNKNARRYIVLSGLMKKVLEDQRAMLKSEGIIHPKWVFPDEIGEQSDPNRIYKAWYTYREQHGIASSIHEMRHTMISVAKADMPEQLLKRMAGHSKSMDTFGVYGHDVDGEMERAAQILDATYRRILE